MDEGTNTITVNVTAESGTTGQTYTVVVNRQSASAFAQTAYVKASNSGTWVDRFGNSVALSGDGTTLAVGALGEASAATGVNGDETDTRDIWRDAGAVYVFTRDGAGTWSQQAYVKASNTDIFDVFGSSVALSGGGTTLAVGAVFEDSGATGVNGDETDNSANHSGAVYIFTRDSAGTWVQRAYIKASNGDGGRVPDGDAGFGDLGDQFGEAVSLSGNGGTLAVGASLESSAANGVNGDETDNSKLGAGAAYVFEL